MSPGRQRKAGPDRIGARRTADYLIDATTSQPSEDVQDRAFYRKFQKADPDVKDKLKKILDVLDEDD